MQSLTGTKQSRHIPDTISLTQLSLSPTPPLNSPCNACFRNTTCFPRIASLPSMASHPFHPQGWAIARFNRLFSGRIFCIAAEIAGPGRTRKRSGTDSGSLGLAVRAAEFRGRGFMGRRANFPSRLVFSSSESSSRKGSMISWEESSTYHRILSR